MGNILARRDMKKESNTFKNDWKQFGLLGGI